MTTGAAENFGQVLDQASLKNGKGDAGAAAAAADAYGPNASTDIKNRGTAKLNESLQNSGIIPGIDIVDTLPDANPNDSLIEVKIAPETPNGADLTRTTNATYDANTHTLKWQRDAVLPGNQGKEDVTVNMLTGQETVSADGGKRLTTRAHVGDQAYTTANIDTAKQPPQVTSTESVGADGSKHKRDYQYKDGQLSGVTIDGKPLALPPGAVVNTDPTKGAIGDVNHTQNREGVKGPVQFNLHPDGSSTMTMPGENGEPGKGRAFNVGADNKINYDVQAGDTLWDVGRDIAQLQGKPNPSPEDIQGIVSQIGHVGQNGDPNTILAGEQITFGAATNQPTADNPAGKNPQDRLDLSSLLPKTDAPGTATPPTPKFDIQNLGKNDATVNINGQAYPLGEGDPSTAHVDDQGVLHYNYKPKDGRGPITVDVHPDGTEITTVGTTKVYRHKAGQEPYKYDTGGNTLENRGGHWWLQHPGGDIVAAGGVNGVDMKTGAVNYWGAGLAAMGQYTL